MHGPWAPVRARRVEAGETAGRGATVDDASAYEVTITPTAGRGAEQWARATFEGAPRVARWFVVAGWRYVLGLRLGPPGSSGHVLGWRIVTTTPEVIVLDVRSALVTATKVLRVENPGLLLTTFVRFESRPGRVIWSAVAPVHHRTEPYLLARAAGQQVSGRRPRRHRGAASPARGGRRGRGSGRRSPTA